MTTTDVEGALTELSGSDLAYLQLALLRISAKVAEKISPAAAHEVTVCAYNDFIRPSSLTEYGEERVRTLANRYGAARFLQGLDALMKSPDFNPETDYDLPALSKMLVSLQGPLQGRRAYLAGVLGSVRKEMSQTPHGTSQRDHSGIAFRELVEARHDAAVLFQPAKHALDDVALSVLGPIKQPW